MAARNQHGHDSAVVERRLRPIYEWLENNNSKKALQEAEKVLKKTPHLQCAKALKALSLLQLGRDAECVHILNTLAAETPCDNSTLQAMTICYRDLQQLEKVCELYEKALRVDPSNEELHTHLFMSYVRTSNFKQQQTTAMSLYKMKPKNPYYFWAVMSVVLQATRGTKDTSQRAVLLSLAERMVDKLAIENRIEAEPEIQLYLLVLERQGKFEHALKVLDGPLGVNLLNGATHNHRIPYLTKLKRWRDLNLLCKEILTASMDRWDVWRHYLTSVLEQTHTGLNNHTDTNNSSENDDPDDSPEKSHEFICSLIESMSGDGLFKGSTSYQLRGPYLARLELWSKLHTAGQNPSALLGDIFELLVEYFRLFGHKPCCVSDLRSYLHLLEMNRRLDLSARLLEDVGIGSTTLPQSEQQMQRHICSLQISRLCGHHMHLDSEYLMALVTALSLHYLNGAQTFGVGRLSTDQGPADAYALLATHVLYDVACMQRNSNLLLLGLVLLEKLLKNSPSNFHAKLLCLRIYHVLGGTKPARKHFESLDTKNLQLDSMGFVHCALLYTTGLISMAISHYDTTLRFFTTNYRDSIDHLTFSYKFGSFLKLEEFMDFRDRLNNSLHFTITAVDRTLLSMVQCTGPKGLDALEASPKNNNIDWDALRDNNDYGVYLSWDPERVDTPLDSCEQIKNLFEQDKELTRIRATLAWGVSSAAEILKSTEENREHNIKALPEVIQDWDNIFEKVINKNLQPIEHNRLCLPLPSRLHSHLSLPYKEIFGSMFRLVHALATGDGLSAKSAVRSAKEMLPKVAEMVRITVSKQNEAEDNLWDKYACMEIAVNSVEIVSLTVLLCNVCSCILKPVQTRKTKRKGPTDVTLKVSLDEITRECRNTVTDLDTILESWQSPKNPLNLIERLGALSISDADCGPVLESLQDSHNAAIRELRGLLASKSKQLGSLVTC